jgi:hypothetical protein
MDFLYVSGGQFRRWGSETLDGATIEGSGIRLTTASFSICTTGIACKGQRYDRVRRRL